MSRGGCGDGWGECKHHVKETIVAASANTAQPSDTDSVAVVKHTALLEWHSLQIGLDDNTVGSTNNINWKYNTELEPSIHNFRDDCGVI